MPMAAVRLCHLGSGIARRSREVRQTVTRLTKTLALMRRGERSSVAGARGRTLRVSRAWVAAVLLVIVAGVVLAGALHQLTVASPGSASAGSDSLASAGVAPDFTARLLGGGEFTLSQHRGKPVLVLFAASWCFDCIPEVDKLARLHEQFGPPGLEPLVLSVDPGDAEADFGALRLHTTGQNLLWGPDPAQKTTLAYKVRATDTKVLIDGRGQIAFRSVGATPFETLRDRVAALLG